MNETYIEYGKKKIPFFIHDLVQTRHGRLKDFISWRVENTHQFFEPDMLEYWKEKFGSITSFVDVGANIGNHSVFAREVLGATKITCFEPYDPNFLILEKNVPEATLHNVGLSDTEGEMTINTELISIAEQPGAYLANQGATNLVPGNGITVKTLDSFQIESCDLLKIDVECMEALVLKGATDTLTRLRPVIYCEANLLVNIVDIVEVLTPLGYYLTSYQDFGSMTAEFTPKEKL